MNDLNVVESGDAAGPTVVLLGSLGSTTAMWEPQVAALGADHRVLAIELPGHGGSAAAPGPYTIEAMADDVVAALDSAGADRAHIAGVSIGGMLAMELATQHRQRVLSIALVCTSAHLPPASNWHERAAIVRADGASAVASTVVSRWLTPGYTESHRDVVDRFVAMISSTDAEGYAACCEAIAAMDLRGELAGIDTPTLVVAGAHDPSTPPDHGRAIADQIPGARFELVDGAHLSSCECAGDVNELFFAHLEKASAA